MGKVKYNMVGIAEKATGFVPDDLARFHKTSGCMNGRDGSRIAFFGGTVEGAGNETVIGKLPRLDSFVVVSEHMVRILDEEIAQGWRYQTASGNKGREGWLVRERGKDTEPVLIGENDLAWANEHGIIKNRPALTGRTNPERVSVFTVANRTNVRVIA